MEIWSRIKTRALFRALLLTSIGCLTSVAANAKCDIQDFQRCTSCADLKVTINLKDPDYGDYYRGAYWNGLYAAYRLNCQIVAVNLLENHANPNLGGTSGSFLISISRSWPHKNISINKQWAEMLRHYPINVDWKNPYTNKSAREIVINKTIPVDYQDIWKSLTKASETKQGAK